MIKDSKDREIINFYGGNPLLHPDFLEIISFCRESGYRNIGLLTNTYGLNKEKLTELMSVGLSSIGIYFNTFDNAAHEMVVNGGITLKELLKNLELINSVGIYHKVIIHVNALNIKHLHNDIVILSKKFGFSDFEFVNYFPFDRPYERFGNLLSFSYNEHRSEIDKFFTKIRLLGIKARFLKFSKDFFGMNVDFYDFQGGVMEQIGTEDLERLKEEPFCFKEKRCENCFIKDNCRYA